jgi:hypothetical protein
MNDGFGEEISGWTDAQLLETARNNPGAGADADLPDEIRFLGGVVRLLSKRLSNHGGSPECDPAAFFLQSVIPDGDTKLASAASVPMLDNGLTPVEGQLWFVGPSVRHGYSVEVFEWSDEALFGCLGSHEVIGVVPTIIFETRTDAPEARYYPRGLSAPDEVRVLPLGGKPIGLGEVIGVVNRIYETQLASPSGLPSQASPWFKSRSFRPHREAEKRIQIVLKAALQGAFPSTIVRSEQSEVIGRLDLEIEEPLPTPGGAIRHALLELKVLRSFRDSGASVSDADNKRAIREGVRQAQQYRDERNVKASALCCFDMRVKASGQACFKGVKRYAKEVDVELVAWHLFASAKAYRDSK